MVRSGPSNECIACEHFVEEWCILKGNDDAACPISKELRLWGFRAEDERYTDGVWRFFKDKFMAQTFAKGKRVVEKDPLTALAMYNKSRFKHYDLSRFLDEFVEKIPPPYQRPIYVEPEENMPTIELSFKDKLGTSNNHYTRILMIEDHPIDDKTFTANGQEYNLELLWTYRERRVPELPVMGLYRVVIFRRLDPPYEYGIKSTLVFDTECKVPKDGGVEFLFFDEGAHTLICLTGLEQSDDGYWFWFPP